MNKKFSAFSIRLFTHAYECNIISLCLLMSIFSLNAQQDEQSLLWKIEKKGQNTSYLFGTNALVKMNFKDEIKSFKKAFAKSDVLINEVRYNQSVTADISGLSVMNENTMDQLLKGDDYVDVAAYFQVKTGLDFRNYNKIKPIAIFMMLNSINNKELGINYNADSEMRSLNQYLQEEAERENKKIFALESVQSQVEMLFKSFSLERQAAILLDLVKNEAQNKIYNQNLLECYLKMKLDCLSEMLFFSDFSPDESRKLIRERNQSWMIQFLKIIPKSSAFIAVGALHLPGEDGLIALFRKAGYKVSPIK